jgi:hypothetical protein
LQPDEDDVEEPMRPRHRLLTMERDNSYDQSGTPISMGATSS